MMAHVDLCSGIGGFALGFEWAGLSKPVLFCDIEPWSRKILKKHWPDVPIAEDVKELADDPDGLIPECSIITAGYPCQPFSLAGERRGSEDDRHIWPYIFSIVQAKRPAWCVFENVYGHVSMGLDEVLSDLEREAYAVRPFVVPACATDAPHRRDRVWIVARNVADTRRKPKGGAAQSERSSSYATRRCGGFNPRNSEVSPTRNVADTKSMHSDGGRKNSQQGERQVSKLGESSGSNDVADADSKRQSGSGLHGRSKHQAKNKARQADWPHNGSQGKAQLWLTEPSICRVANGIPNRVDRLRGLGNAIVPQVAMRIGQTIKAINDG